MVKTSLCIIACIILYVISYSFVVKRIAMYGNSAFGSESVVLVRGQYLHELYYPIGSFEAWLRSKLNNERPKHKWAYRTF